MRFISVLFCSLLAISITAQAQNRFRGIAVDPSISVQDIDDLASALGPKMVRYNLTHYIVADNESIADYLTWLDSALNELDARLPHFERNNMKVMVQLYTPPGGFISYDSPPFHRVFNSADHQAAFITTWERIATRYANSSVVWGYDLLNEPAERSVASGLKSWTLLADQAARVVRAIDPNKPILIEPIYGNPAKLGKLKLPKIPNIMLAIHSYYPSAFNQQCLYGKKCGIKYPGRYSKATIQLNFAKAIAYAKKHKVKIFLNEFSVIRWAPANSSIRFMRDLLSVVEKYKWSWIYHAWREADAWSVEHTTVRLNLQRSPTETDRAALLRRHFARR